MSMLTQVLTLFSTPLLVVQDEFEHLLTAPATRQLAIELIEHIDRERNSEELVDAVYVALLTSTPADVFAVATNLEFQDYWDTIYAEARGRPATTAELVQAASGYSGRVSESRSRRIRDLTSVDQSGIRELSGRLTTLAGEPIADALVYVWSVKNLERTRGDGSFTLSLPLTRHVTAILTFADGFAVGCKEIRLDESEIAAAQGAVLKVEKEVARGGRVVDAKGIPVAGATVLAHMKAETRFINHSPYSVRAQSDSDGRFEFWGMGPTSQINWLRCLHPHVGQKSVDQPGSNDWTITMDPAVPLRGRLVGPDERPVALARIEARGPDGRGYYCSALSRQDGSFTIGVDPNARRLVVQCGLQDLAPAYLEIDPPNLNEKSEVEIRMEKGSYISGKVLMPDGSPAATAQVSTYGKPMPKDARRYNDPLGFYCVCSCDDEGRFRLGPLTADYEFELEARVWTPYLLAIGTAKSGADDVVLSVKPENQ